MNVELWTDGSGTSSGPGGWAFVLRAFDDEGQVRAERVGVGGVDEATNNRMELTALLEGLRAISLPATVRVFTDSEYVARAFTDGYLDSWIERGWHKRTGGPVRNVDLWKAIVAIAGPHELAFEWVAGHTGVELNERCDRLAGQARRLVLDELAPREEAVAA